MLNKNTAPYFDSFNEDKQFHQVLFRPTYPVQARELNELQSILQNQIERFGNHIFKEGSMVIPGQLSVDLKYAYVKVESIFDGVSVAEYVQELIDSDVTLIGETNGVTARIVGFAEATDLDPLTIFVKYMGSGASGEISEFLPSENLYSDETVSRGLLVKPVEDIPIGFGSAVNIQRGVYFIRGKFVMVTPQTHIMDKYSNTPTDKIGLFVSEAFITPEEDSSLLDNAQGSSNYSAPGAHRLYINLTLTSGTSSSDFIELLSIENGEIQRIIDTSVYSIIEETLARRTFDESGNYTVTPFNIQVKEHRSNDRGAWAPNTQYIVGDITSVDGRLYTAETSGMSGVVAPTHTSGVQSNGGLSFVYEMSPTYNSGAFESGNENYIAVGIDAGKAYVQGHEIINQTTKFLAADKALSTDSQRSGTVPVVIGSYAKVDALYGSLDVTAYPTVKLYDRYIVTNGVASGTQVGTAVARYVEYDTGTIGTATYILSLVDIKLNSGKKFEADVRSIYFDNATGVDFTCNIQKNLTKILGSVTTAAASAAVTGLGTSFTKELNPGDAFVVYNGATPSILSVLSIASDTSLTLTAVAGVTLTNTPAYKSTSALIDSFNQSLIFNIPHSFVKSVRSIDNLANSNASYYSRQKFSSVAAAGACIISTTSSNDTFGSPQQPDSFLVVSATTGEYINATTTLSPDSLTATIVVGAGHNGSTITIIATVRKVLRERTKTLIRYYSEDILTQANVIANLVNLSKTDGIKIRKVSTFHVAGTPCAFGVAIPGGATEVDITSSFAFGTGQTDAYYGNAFISRVPGSGAPNSPIRVVYDYYDHSSLGDYFSVDSYSGNIPTYTTSTGITKSLRDCIDFRCDKIGSTFSPVVVPAIGFDFISDYSYYLPRIDKLYLTGSGTFAIKSGIPSLKPVEPATPTNSMALAVLKFVPKTESVSSSTVIVDKIDNKRYTMRDIGNIDKRLQNVEYYTALSLLEQQTYNMQLFDVNGNLNFKNGFIVEPFTGQNIGDVTSNEFRCSIDPMATLMRPGFSIDNINLVESTSTDVGRLAQHYVNNDNIITLPFTEVSAITQPFASRTESITPFIQFAFLGTVDLLPKTDEWYETTYAPAVIVQQEGNYSALENAYRSQLGTVWNAWQTNWSSVAVNSSSSTSVQNGTQWIDNSPQNTISTLLTTTTNTTTTSGQVRSGTNTVIQAVYTSSVVDDRIIQVDILPYIRSRAVMFSAKGMRPATRVYPFFESVAVDSHVVPATYLGMSIKNGEFNTTTQAGSDANHASRKMADNNASVSLSVGDVIHNGFGGNRAIATATAVVVIDETYAVRVVNVKGTFTLGETVYGTISGSSGVISIIVIPPTLITNEYGEVSGIFTIPSSAQIRFLSGQRTFRLTSSSSNDSTYSTRADGRYTATGYLQIHQQTIVSTRNGVVQQTSLSDSRTVSSTTTNTSNSIVDTQILIDSGGGGGDPLAQSFTVPSAVGMFVTSVDVYFAGKDRSISMWFNIVEMDNGIPTTKVIPGSRIILKPTQITTSTNGSIPTRIKMPHPIFLKGDTEYAFVMGSDSLNYSVWTSHLGEKDILSGGLIVSQPYLGSMFKSQNASTWNPSQMDDVKFIINRANFDISKSANAKFIATDLPTIKLPSTPIFTRIGSNYIRVICYNHGLFVGSKVTLSGAILTNGIPAVDLNKQHTVTSVDFDSFVVQVATNATSTGYSGGSDVVASKNVRMDIAQVVASQLVFDGTSAKHFVTPTNTSYTKQAEAIEVSANENTKFISPMLVASSENEVAFMSSNRSIETVAQLTSSNSYISPVLDLDRYSIVAVGNRINQPSASANIAGLDSVTLGSSTAIAFTAGSTITTASAQSLFLQAKVGRTLTITGAATGGNNGTFLISAIAADGTSITFSDKTFVVGATGPSITLVLNDRYVSEVSSNDGSADAKYIIKSMTLSLPANQLSIYLDVNKPSSVSFDMYYRIGTSGSNLTNSSWNLISPVSQIKSSENAGVFDGVVYQLTSSTEFDTAQIKIVQRSTDTTKVALVKNLRMIAMS